MYKGEGRAYLHLPAKWLVGRKLLWWGEGPKGVVAGCVAPGRTKSFFSSVASDRGPGHQTQEPDAKVQVRFKQHGWDRGRPQMATGRVSLSAPWRSLSALGGRRRPCTECCCSPVIMGQWISLSGIFSHYSVFTLNRVSPGDAPRQKVLGSDWLESTWNTS